MNLFDGWPAVAVVLLVVVLAAVAIVAVALFVKLLRTYRLVRSEVMPTGGKVAFWATVVYLLSPIDLLPDPIMIDDIAALVATIGYITSLARQHGLIGPGESATAPGRSPWSGRDDVIDVSVADEVRPDGPAGSGSDGASTSAERSRRR